MAKDDAIDNAVTLLYETVLDESRRDAAMAAFARAFDAPQAIRMRFDFGGGGMTEFHTHGHEAHVLRLYAQHYHAIDPGGLPAMRAAVGQWLADETLFDRRARDQQQYALDFALPNGIGWQAGGKVESTSPREGLWFGVTRHPDDQRFGAQGERVFNRLLPHLQQVARLEARVKQLAHGQAVAQASLDMLKAAVCVVDRTRRVQLLNGLGERLFGGGDALRVLGGRLLCSHAALDERLAALVAQACAPLPRGGAFTLARVGAVLSLQVMVVPIPRHHHAARLLSQPLALVVAVDPQASHLPRDTYQGLFGLTDTETALLWALVQGDSLAQWAEARGVSITTARTHLAAVFGKTGTDSQARLLRLAKTLPAMG